MTKMAQGGAADEMSGVSVGISWRRGRRGGKGVEERFREGKAAECSGYRAIYHFCELGLRGNTGRGEELS